MKNIVSVLFTLLFLIFSVSAQNSPLRLTFQPKPEMPPNYGTLDVEATTVLRARFLSNGKIGKIEIISGFVQSLNEKAIEAARKIKFNPAIMDGKTASSSRLIFYHYSWKHGWQVYPNIIATDSKKTVQKDEKAEAVIQKAVEKLGGARYLQVKTIVSSGNYTLFRGGMADLPSSFIDVISFPNKERTEFKQGGNKTIQTNSGESGWIFDAGTQTLRDQNAAEIEGFKKTMRTSLDNILRGEWRRENAVLSYVGKRPASLGKRNEVVKLVYPDGFAVEFEFDANDAMPMKSVFDGKDADGVAAKEEERYAQFVEIQGVFVPFIVDRYVGGKQQSRINYSKIELNKNVPETIFAKPADVKNLKKDLKI